MNCYKHIVLIWVLINDLPVKFNLGFFKTQSLIISCLCFLYLYNQFMQEILCFYEYSDLEISNFIIRIFFQTIFIVFIALSQPIHSTQTYSQLMAQNPHPHYKIQSTNSFNLNVYMHLLIGQLRLFHMMEIFFTRGISIYVPSLRYLYLFINYNSS